MENVKQFLLKVAENEDLANELKGANSKDDIVQIADKHGYSLGEEQLSFLKQVSIQQTGESLSEEELENVSGGKRVNIFGEAGRWVDDRARKAENFVNDVWNSFIRNL